MGIIGRIFSYLVSPSAIGIYITLVFTIGAFFFYLTRDFDTRSGLFETLEFIHDKTIDFRLKARGPRKGSERVAILDIDDRSLQEIGRWPWPRKKIAEVVRGVMKYNPSVISFDIVFSEEQQNPVASSFKKMRKTVGVESPELSEFIEQEITSQNQDLKLADAIEAHSDQLVLGSFFNKEYYTYGQAYKNKCKSIAFSLTRGAEVFDNEEAPPIVIVENDYDLPDPLIDLLIEKFEETAEEITEEFLQENGLGSLSEANQAQRDVAEFKVYEKHAIYCDSFLNTSGTNQDPYLEEIREIWPDIVEDDEDFEGLSFEDGIEKIRNRNLGNPIVAGEGYQFNVPTLSEVTKHTGFFVANVDEDGTIRTAHLLSRVGSSSETYLLPISFKAFLVAEGLNVQTVLKGNPFTYYTSNRVETIRVIDDEGAPKFDIPVDSKGNMRINYAGPSRMFPYISAAEFLNDDEMATISQRVWDEEAQEWILRNDIKVNKAEFLKEKILLFGPSATGIFDLRVTPFEEIYPGVETHANVLDNIVRQDFLKNFPDEHEIMIFVLLISGVLLSFLIGILGALPGMMVTMGSIAGFILADYHFLFLNGIVSTVMFPVALTFALYVTMTFYKYFTEERKKRGLKGTFSKYVSPAIVDEILKDPTNIELGGKKQRITVFFSDVRGFTTISERLDPQALSDLLNSYLTPMTELVFEHKGTLDKYMGDAIMAFFGAPIHYSDHAKHACRCALAHLEKLRALQKEYEEKGLPLIDVGIGLNTGDMSVGNMGSNTIRSYTVMGDAVNLGARLEGINKQYGTRIIISEFTYQDVSDSFTCREIDWVKVKGKDEPVRIFELVSEGNPKENVGKMLDHFNQGFKHYHEMKFDEAIASFNSGLEFVEDDFCSKMYIDRCQGYQDSPPPADWDGVFVMTTK